MRILSSLWSEGDRGNIDALTLHAVGRDMTTAMLRLVKCLRVFDTIQLSGW
ncbi:hypothetical protein NTG1052_410052 [Candidatus Nitrotoga sp. 1052]|nr:hypothetical protein NTG1052_410052 [Candidatus Nitrotoga sp. 1052]